MRDALGVGEGRGHAVVVGGSIAGLLVASVLARHAARVTIIERDHYPNGPEPRAGVPQGRQGHILLPGGADALAELLPDLAGELAAAGVPQVGLLRDALQWAEGRWYDRRGATVHLACATRPLLEHLVRRLVLAEPRITVIEGSEVIGLVGDAATVRGVRVRERGAGSLHNVQEVVADLVVDASGRSSRAPAWLAELGAAAPSEEVVETGLGYATREYLADPDWGFTDARMIYLIGNPRRPRGAVIVPTQTPGRYQVTLSGLRAQVPPGDPEGFEAFASELHPVVRRWLDAAEPDSAVFGFRRTANVRRRYDRGNLPAGFLAAGDALCTVNPIYGQGMATAAQGAVALDRLLRRGPTGARTAQRALLAAANPAWTIATGADKTMPGVTGNAARVSAAQRVVNSYIARLAKRSFVDFEVGNAYREVIVLRASPVTLFAPPVLRRVLFGAPVSTTFAGDEPMLWLPGDPPPTR